jgi:succinate-semialdehyde dehydrogenase/glutarate-semialdehyde dehydrogenase
MGIMPWNFPFWQVIRFAVPVLISGNTIVLKHASNVSLCSLALEELFSRAYPDGAIFKSLLIRGKDTEQVLREGYVNGVSVTGSEQTGRSVGEAAGASIIKQVYELGGNDAFIVFEDVDLEYVAKAAVKSRLINCGQSCISAKRFMIQNSVYDESAFADTLTSTIKQASAHGAETLNPFHREGAFIAPNLLLNVDERNPVYDEELFGPIGMVHRFNRSDDAINLANHSRFGLSASVWTMDIKRADYVANAIKSGSVFINMYPQSDAAVPFGGIKCSGYGREMGRDGLLEFTNKKAIIIP